MALAAAAGAWVAVPLPLVVGVGAAVAGLALRRAALVVVAAALLTSALSARAWSGLREPRGLPRSWRGVATLVGDPTDASGALRVDVRVGHRRVEAWARRAGAARLRERLAGERVELDGVLEPLPANVRAQLHRRHVVARLTVRDVGAWRRGDALTQLANAIRRTLVRGAASLPPARRALFMGFVLGDDRGQSPEVVDDFRASGLAHLLVVSGENVAFVLALCAPVLARLRLWPRLLVGLALLGLFGLVTRGEPSVLRAEAMTALVLFAQTIGRPVSGVRVLALGVTAVLLLDPLLVGSVGFLLSVGACLGIAVAAAPLRDALPGPRPLASAAAVTAAAQIGVAPVLIPVFGGLPVASLPANLLAVPAAGPLTMWGLAAGLPAGVVGGVFARVIHVPTGLLVRWIAAVARWSAALPLGSVGLAGAAALAAAVTLGVAGHRVGRRWLRWTGLAAAAAVLVASASAAWRAGGAIGDELAPGARLWRAGNATVAVVEGARAGPLLAGLRRAHVRRIDVLVVAERGALAAHEVTSVLRRVPARVVVVLRLGLLQAPATARVVVAAAGTVVGAGPFDVTVRALAPRVIVDVTRRPRLQPVEG